MTVIWKGFSLLHFLCSLAEATLIAEQGFTLGGLTEGNVHYWRFTLFVSWPWLSGKGGRGRSNVNSSKEDRVCLVAEWSTQRWEIRVQFLNSKTLFLGLLQSCVFGREVGTYWIKQHTLPPKTYTLHLLEESVVLLCFPPTHVIQCLWISIFIVICTLQDTQKAHTYNAWNSCFVCDV